MSQTVTAALVALTIALLRPPGAEAQPAHCTTPLPDCGALGFPNPATQPIEQQVHTFAEAATVGMDGCGRFLVGFQADGANLGRENKFDILFQRYDPSAAPFGQDPQIVSVDGPTSFGHDHRSPSAGISSLGSVRLAWEADSFDGHPQIGPLAIFRDFAFDTPPAPLGVPGGAPPCRA